jgi:hypothetical protein
MLDALLFLAASALSPTLPAGVQAVGTARVRIVRGTPVIAARPAPQGARRSRTGIIDFQ